MGIPKSPGKSDHRWLPGVTTESNGGLELERHDRVGLDRFRRQVRHDNPATGERIGYHALHSVAVSKGGYVVKDAETTEPQLSGYPSG